jgi:hypothetical protein
MILKEKMIGNLIINIVSVLVVVVVVRKGSAGSCIFKN